MAGRVDESDLDCPILFCPYTESGQNAPVVICEARHTISRRAVHQVRSLVHFRTACTPASHSTSLATPLSRPVCATCAPHGTFLLVLFFPPCTAAAATGTAAHSALARALGDQCCFTLWHVLIICRPSELASTCRSCRSFRRSAPTRPARSASASCCTAAPGASTWMLASLRRCARPCSMRTGTPSSACGRALPARQSAHRGAGVLHTFVRFNSSISRCALA